MESTAWSAESREALAAVAASVAAPAVFSGSGQDHADPTGIDPTGVDQSGDVPSREAESGPLPADLLRDLADACLDGLGELARQEARSAALKVLLTADYAKATRTMASPALSPHERTVQEMARWSLSSPVS
jgi:hypothetical protein